MFQEDLPRFVVAQDAREDAHFLQREDFILVDPVAKSVRSKPAAEMACLKRDDLKLKRILRW